MDTENKKSPFVLAAVDDLFFWAKIEATARHAGVRLEQATNATQFDERLSAGAPDLIIMDLNCSNCDPLNTIRKIRSRPDFASVRLVGFVSHVQVELEKAALSAGCDRVLPRSKFSANLSAILRNKYS